MQLELIEILKFNSIQSNPKTLNVIEISLNSNSIEEKWDANWCIRYWNFAHDYVVDFFFNFLNIRKDTFSSFFTLELSKNILFWNYRPKQWLIKSKVVIPQLVLINHHH
jgi:hypothetical protein